MIDRFKECVADLNIPKGWEDISYRNDACPSWLYNDFQIMILHPTQLIVIIVFLIGLGLIFFMGKIALD